MMTCDAATVQKYDVVPAFAIFEKKENKSFQPGKVYFCNTDLRFGLYIEFD